MRAEGQLAEAERKLAAKRHNLRQALVNDLITKGDTIKAEALEYKGWQRGLYGKSIGRSAPGAFIAQLRAKTERLGGQFIDVPTRTTKCSQLCHGCGTYVKKPLALRTHQCACGVGPIDRDIYSAFLVRTFSLADKSLDVGVARATFAALQCGATGVQGANKLRGGRKRASATPLQARERKSGSGADGALAQGEAFPAQGEKKALPLPAPSGDERAQLLLFPGNYG